MSDRRMNIVVTGANSGLGQGICLRLIDDFLNGDFPAKRLNIIFTTRSTRKSADTLKALQTHLQRQHPPTQHDRVTFQPESVDLTKLLSVQALARKLVSSDLEALDTIICNAGIGGWLGLDWPMAIRDILLDFRTATTFPQFKLGIIGAVTNRQLPAGSGTEPPLGEVFCANVFGHYMLAHWLMPLLRSCEEEKPAKIIWLSSTEPLAEHWSLDDVQGLATNSPYESSKRLTDLLALTSNLPSSDTWVKSFISTDSAPTKELAAKPRSLRSEPAHYACQPGIVVTSVISLPWILAQGYLLAIYIARWLGGVWSTVDPYVAAHSMTWAALSPVPVIDAAEHGAQAAANTGSQIVKNGHVKWGTSISRTGKTQVRPTEVDDWGINGQGTLYVHQWWGGNFGRRPGTKEARPSDVERFMALGAEAWEHMEKLREEWEARIETPSGQ